MRKLIEIGSKVELTDRQGKRLQGELIDAINYGGNIIYTVQVGLYHYQGNSRTVKKIKE